MGSISNRRYLLLSALLPLALGLACSKRSGLDRGDANESMLRQRDSDNVETSEEGREFSARQTAPSQQRFARAPSESMANSESDDGAANTRAATNASSPASPPAKSYVAPPAAPSGRAKAPPEGATELHARGSSAYSPSARADSFRPREERPGLGTSWGETRKSWVSAVRFQREDPNQPTASARIYYNDADGVMAQTGERAFATTGTNITDLGRGFVTVEIVDTDGVPLPGLVSGGNSYVVGRSGDHYAIRIRNQERYRVEVVATVDGLDVIDGSTGTFQKRGYVIDPYGSLTIEGFRKSTSAVAAFRFGAVSNSYAARTGSDRHVGVIGIALFAERGCCDEPYSASEIRRRESAEPFPGQFARPPQPRRQYWAE